MTGPSVQSIQQKPPVVEEEVLRLAERYGAPLRRSFRVTADETALAYRFGGKGDRRAEVVFAVQDPCGSIWVHAKASYPRQVYRLPSGGIHWPESVEDALLREIAEETALPVQVRRFLGLIEYEFLHQGETAPFASYVFWVQSLGGVPQPQEGEGITSFQLVPPDRLVELAAGLRSLAGDRRAWGEWRALVLDLVHAALADPAL